MKNRIIFSIFYTAIASFPHVVTLVYWLILVPHEQTTCELHFDIDTLCFKMGSFSDMCHIAEDLFGQGLFKPFVILNKFGINSLIALIEILALSSIKRQEVG